SLRGLAKSGKLPDGKPADADRLPEPRVLRESGLSDAPDVAAIVARQRSELQPVIQRYLTDRGKRFRTGESRSGQFSADWLAALDKLDFDRLSHDGQIDYLLLKNQIRRELDRNE